MVLDCQLPVDEVGQQERSRISQSFSRRIDLLPRIQRDQCPPVRHSRVSVHLHLVPHLFPSLSNKLNKPRLHANQLSTFLLSSLQQRKISDLVSPTPPTTGLSKHFQR